MSTSFSLKKSTTDSSTNNQPRPKKSYPIIPDGRVVNVEIIDVQLRNIPTEFIRNPDRTQEVSWHVKVTDGQYTDAHVWGTTAPWFNPKPNCRFRLWVEAALGVPQIPSDFELDTTDTVDRNNNSVEVFEMLAGLRCRAEIEVYQTKAGEDRHKVGNLLPAQAYSDVEELFGAPVAVQAEKQSTLLPPGQQVEYTDEDAFT